MRVTTHAKADWQPGFPGKILGDSRLFLFDIPREETWHSHPRGQILVAISGLGLIQAEGSEVVELEPGDSIWAPPGERHWHGAAPGHDFTATSIQPIDPSTGTYADW
jgi:mannose-6-phosphate isomerase-like protein (cupin superfamily)